MRVRLFASAARRSIVRSGPFPLSSMFVVIVCLAFASTARAQTGACCIAGGGAIQCQNLTAADCDAAGGTFLGAGTSCGADSCVNNAPTGACCIPFSCFTTTEQNCSANGGQFLGLGSTCDPFPCSTPTTGACCLDDVGLCIDTDAGQCDNLKGTFHPGTTCEELDCGSPPPPPPPTGACCTLSLNGYGCSIMTEAACLAGGGTYHGDGSSCFPIPCDPGSGPTGACCVIGGGAIVCTVVRESICNDLGGTFRGKDTTCADVACVMGDTNADESVDVDDLINVILTWGDCPEGGPSQCPTDLSRNGEVEVDDLIIVILHWAA